MNRCMMEMKAEVGNVSAGLKWKGVWWTVVTCLSADDIVLQRIKKKKNESIGYVWDKLKANHGKSKMIMVFVLEK